ncbi:MAG: SRPBCC family protein [Jatrophihabitans sp.]|uniref:SRPBCC family protein n=1 Tax=Jatrophihabitans sp. TaxID=1932789 RepID=UPI003F7DC322
MTARTSRPGRHQLQGERVIKADLADVYRMLLEPAEQLRWNSLYLEAFIDPPGPITSGTRLTGRFKGSGRAEVTFVDVVPDEQFTHHSVMRLPGTAIRLGGFDHTYRVAATAEGTQVCQYVRFAPSGVGRLLAPLIMLSFRRRLPASFEELQRYVEKTGTADEPPPQRDSSGLGS